MRRNTSQTSPQTTSKGRVSVRECGRRLPSIATRGRLQSGPGRNRAMEGGATLATSPTSDPPVWRRRARLVRVASGLASSCAATVHPPCKPPPAAEAVAGRRFPVIRERAGFPSRNPSTPSSGRGPKPRPILHKGEGPARDAPARRLNIDLRTNPADQLNASKQNPNRQKPKCSGANVPFAKRKGTRTSEAQRTDKRAGDARGGEGPRTSQTTNHTFLCANV